MPDDKKIIEPINAEFDQVARAMVATTAGLPAPIPSTEFQLPLPLVQYELEREVIYQRIKDGYVNATAMCKAAGKAWADYNRLASSQAFFQALSADMGIPITEIIQSIKGGEPSLQGTWVHPQVAIHLAQWLSPEFATNKRLVVPVTELLITRRRVV